MLSRVRARDNDDNAGAEKPNSKKFFRKEKPARQKVTPAQAAQDKNRLPQRMIIFADSISFPLSGQSGNEIDYYERYEIF